MDVFKTLILDTPDSLGNISGVLDVANGGTGADNAPDARVNLLPDYTGNANKVLSLNGTATDVEWTSNGAGDVVGPASATDNAVVRYDGTTGKLVQDSGVAIDDSGNVGVGTTAPSTFRTKVLEVADAANAGIVVNGDATNAFASLRLTNSGTSGWDVNYNFPNVGDLGFFDIGAADTRMVIDDSGNVGIGLTAPVNKLEIVGTNAAAATSGSAANGAMRLYGSGSGAVLDSGIGGDAGWLQARIYNNYASQLPLLLNPNGGNVVIGTADINGGTIDGTTIGATTPSTGAFTTLTAGNGAPGYPGITLNGASGGVVNFEKAGVNNGTIYAGNGLFVIDTVTSNNLTLQYAGATKAEIYSNGLAVTGAISSTSTISAAGGIEIGNDSSYLYDTGTGAVTLRLGASGPYGSFVTDSGVFMLDGPSGVLALGTAGVRRAVLSSAGNFGIGTSSPSARLSVVENAEAIGITLQGSSTDSGISISNTGTNGKEWVLYSSSDGSGLGSGNFNIFQRGAGGGSRLAIDDTGNIGVGTLSPNAKLTVFGNSIFTVADNAYATAFNATSGNVRILPYYSTTGGSAIIAYAAGYAGNGPLDIESSSTRFRAGGSERMRIDSAGNVGIGTSPAYKLHVATAGNNYIVSQNSAGSTSALLFGAESGSTSIYSWTTPTSNIGVPLKFRVGATESMRIDSSGNVLIGGTALPTGSTSMMAWDNTNKWIRLSKATTAYTAHVAFYNSNGAVGTITTDGSATAYNTSSDYRLKENVVPMSDALQRIGNLKPSRFNFIADDSVVVDGFIAHEVQEVVPEAITGEKDAMRDEEYEVTPAVLDDDGNEVTPAVMGTRSVPEYQGIDQSKLVPLLVGAVQELTARLEALENN